MKNNKYEGYLIDLDGTVYRGPKTIQTGVNFVHRLQEKDIEYLFLTNNTTRTREMVVDKLKRHGIDTDVDHIYTPVLATISYLLEENPDLDKIPVYIIGQVGLKEGMLSDEHFYLDETHPKYVIVGMDTDLTYHKIRIACRAIRNGATFIGTNQDMNLPSGDELLPGNGSQCAMITAATGVKPIFIGKPSSIIINYALELMKLDKSRALIVGDNYDTDIMAGINCHMDTLLTLTGVSTVAQIENKQTKPTYTVENLDKWLV
ncbi:4-nitrophenyl phosphatase [Lactobacillus colini]|uniref:Acid sugar phosphatase n=1 Tax=Lactobacillus colini TaxID=1819254 RepID=A0ABS4MGZ3_9LACO|nr:4-nitrophenyl phosphatase [Lactobacillus colini]